MKIEYLNISRRTGLLDLFKEKGFKVGVEVGTDRGGYALDICKRMPGVELYTMDPWIPYIEGIVVKTEENMKAFETEARTILAPYPNCVVLKDTSMNIVNTFRDNTIDFVFIDGNHEYEEVYKDIVEWTKKVKNGGIVCGHDYIKDDSKKYGVVEAVNQYVEENNIEPLYILKRGTFVPCWMFYKK